VEQLDLFKEDGGWSRRRHGCRRGDRVVDEGHEKGNGNDCGLGLEEVMGVGYVQASFAG
jgi:hypothetical protein